MNVEGTFTMREDAWDEERTYSIRLVVRQAWSSLNRSG